MGITLGTGEPLKGHRPGPEDAGKGSGGGYLLKDESASEKVYEGDSRQREPRGQGPGGMLAAPPSTPGLRLEGALRRGWKPRSYLTLLCCPLEQ